MNFNYSQLQAINHKEGPALILAVPGAGKTTVLIHRTAKLINDFQVDPKNILSISFSRASAKDMKERFISFYPNSNVVFSTIHSLAFKIIRDYAVKKKLHLVLLESKNAQVNKHQLLREIYKKYNNKAISEEKLESLHTSIGYVKNMMLSPKEIQTKDWDVEYFYNIFSDYESFKRQNNYIDFDDMLTLCLEVLEKDRKILSKYQSLYKFVQVDEAQDTSKVQIEIIKLLALPENNLFIVADDDQSIYGFRGAYPDELFSFKSIYPNAKIFYMNKNYRSTKSIVRLSNDFISQNTKRYEKEIITDNHDGNKVRIKKVKNLEEQYNFLIDDIFKNKDFDNTAILFRNNISSIGVIDYLDKNQIPFYTREVHSKFFNHFIIKDIINFFSFAENTSDVFLFEKIYFKMKGYISRKQVNYIKTLNYQDSVFDRFFKMPGNNDFYLNNFNELASDFDRLSKLNFRQGISFIQANLEYSNYLKDSEKWLGQSYNSLKNILELLKIIGKNCKNHHEFLVRLKEIKKSSSKYDYGVNLSTVHSAKGLEFKNVYIIDLLEGTFPDTKSLTEYESNKIDNYEEERRLFYVAMTRAKENLVLVTAKDKSFSYKPSPFINEIESL